jgi:predicted aldo/keto reductase-like oxidoreductase
MLYRTAPRIGVPLSLFSMGGHEYLADGRSRGFNEDMQKATRDIGYIFDGFGGSRRLDVLGTAYEAGVNFFDVTQDSEKEALGRNLKASPPPYDIYVQTRPEGMCYSYDEFNLGLADYAKLRAEIERALGLLQRDHVDFLNVGILAWAHEHDPDYFAKLADNIARLKKAGLIRWASADTFSGEATFLKMFASGAFDSCNLNFNFGDWGARRKVIAAAAEAGMAVFMREAFLKGPLFAFGAEAGITDRAALAAAALRWCLSFPEATSVTIGTGNPAHLRANLAVIDNPRLSEADMALLERLRDGSKSFRAFEAQRTAEYFAADKVLA